MAINSRQARREAEEKRKDLYNDYYARFCSIFDDAVEVENLPDDLPKRYLLKQLLAKGGIAFDKQTKLYLPFVGALINVYGLPKQYHLIGYNGFNVTRSVDEVVILRANDRQYALSNYLKIQIEKLIDYDMAIQQNVDACKTMTLVEVANQETLNTLQNANESRRIGASLIFNRKSVNFQDALTVASTGATYLGDKFMELRKEVINETLATLGISTANTDKRERVQDSEINAGNGYALASLNVLINTFNYDAEVGGLDIRLKGNTDLVLTNELDLALQEKEMEGDIDA